MMNNVRWNVTVSPQVDRSVRKFLAAQRGGRRRDLSRFIEAAVQSYLLESAAGQTTQAAGAKSAEEMEDLIDEAVRWARKP